MKWLFLWTGIALTVLLWLDGEVMLSAPLTCYVGASILNKLDDRR